MNIFLRFSICFLASLIFYSSPVNAEEGKAPATGKPKGRPAIVELAPLVTGEITDEIALSGTVFYKEVSEVAAEVSGKVKSVSFDEGESVRVVTGPFANFSGYVDEVMVDKEKLRVMVQVFGRATPVVLDYGSVEKA